MHRLALVIGPVAEERRLIVRSLGEGSFQVIGAADTIPGFIQLIEFW
jgi:hypothetical protein